MFTIQHPLLVFYQVHRRTGTIERSCIFLNEDNEPLRVAIAFDFPKHSWVQVYGPGIETGASEGEALELQPGANTVVISFNTDNFNFPDEEFKGRISFRDIDDPSSSDRLQIRFENICDLETFNGYAAIDIGTSSSTKSLYHIRKDAARREPWNPKLNAFSVFPAFSLPTNARTEASSNPWISSTPSARMSANARRIMKTSRAS